MRPGRRVDQLRGDAHSARCPAQAAFQHVAHAQLAAHLPHVHGSALVSKARVARDDEQPANARQCRDDVLHDAVGEVFLLRVTAQVHEWQDGDRGPVGKGQSLCSRFIRYGGLDVRESDPPAVDASRTSPTNRNPLRATVRIRRCSWPLSPIALRAALMWLARVDSETIRPPHTASSRSSRAHDMLAVLHQVEQQIEDLRTGRDHRDPRDSSRRSGSSTQSPNTNAFSVPQPPRVRITKPPPSTTTGRTSAC